MTYLRIGNIIAQSLPREKTARISPEQLERLKTAGEIALAIIAAGGIVALSAVAPNMLSALDRLFLRKSGSRRFTRKEKARKISRIFYYLKDSGYIRLKPTTNDFKVFLTSLGKKRLAKLEVETLAIDKPSSWDGKWWQIAADIPTKDYKRAADLFRQKLKDLKFYPLQRTLWLHPYDPRSEIDFLLHYFGIAKFVTVMEINRLDREDEAKVKAFFEKEGIL